MDLTLRRLLPLDGHQLTHNQTQATTSNNTPSSWYAEVDRRTVPVSNTTLSEARWIW